MAAMTTAAMTTTGAKRGVACAARPPASGARRQRAATLRAAAEGSSNAAVGRRGVGLCIGGFVAEAGAALLPADEARAGLLFGNNSEDTYVNETTAVLGVLKDTLALTSESEDKEAKVDAVRSVSNKWVAKYRRNANFTGRPSYGNTYSAINALLGHYNNFGSNTLFPKKRVERVSKEVDDAGRALARGR